MAANLTVAANKRVRGEILALLYSVQPVPVEIRTITNSLLESNMVSVPSIAQHIDYRPPALIGDFYQLAE